eukprot:2061152-Prymnesium_polylepis.1
MPATAAAAAATAAAAGARAIRSCARAASVWRVPSGCMCARMWRSEPQPNPAASVHAACQPVQSSQHCARSGMVEPVGSTGRSAGVQPSPTVLELFGATIRGQKRRGKTGARWRRERPPARLAPVWGTLAS